MRNSRQSLAETLKAFSLDESASENERALALKALDKVSHDIVHDDALVDSRLSIANDSESDLEDRLSLLTYVFTGFNVLFYIDDGEANVFGEERDVDVVKAVIEYAESLIQERSITGSKRRNALYHKVTKSTGTDKSLSMFYGQPDVQNELFMKLKQKKNGNVSTSYCHDIKVDGRSLRSFSDL